MKQQDGWREHLSPDVGRLSGPDVESSLLALLMAVAIIVAVAGMVITLAAAGVLLPSVTADSSSIGA